MKNAVAWFLSPTVSEDGSAANAWRLRVWAGVGLLLVALFLASSVWGFFWILVWLFLAYWIYAVARMFYARVRRVHIPTRQELLDRYTDDPEAHV